MEEQQEQQEQQRIAYLGSQGSFTHSAAKKYFVQNASFVSCQSLSEIFAKVESKLCTNGVIPLENSMRGSIVESYDLLQRNQKTISIVGEIYLRINHCLVGLRERREVDDFAWVKQCFSHPQAIAQCREFLLSHPWITALYSSDTASAAQSIAKARIDTHVAIAGKDAAKRYNLTILKENLEHSVHNYTRFGIIGNYHKHKGDKISLALTLPHIPGSLLSILTPFANLSLNVTKIESRPKEDKPWEYDFFLDVEIGAQHGKAKEALAQLSHLTRYSLLGWYKKGVLHET